jgi:hypothetical protein
VQDQQQRLGEQQQILGAQQAAIARLQDRLVEVERQARGRKQ